MMTSTTRASIIAQEKGDNNSEEHQHHQTNVIVMSDSGKPIFARYGNEEDVARICGLLQAIRASVLYNKNFDTGEIRSLKSNNSMCLVFMVVGSITLVAISSRGRQATKTTTTSETEAYLRLQLEYIFSHIMVVLTDKVQTIFQQNASFDLRSMLGETHHHVFRTVLDAMGTVDGNNNKDNNPAPFLTGSCNVFFPLSPNVREKASRVLQIVGDATPDTVFALLFADNKLVTVVQPSFRPHQLRVSDLHVVFEQFVAKQPGLWDSELWLPVCLPRFNSSGFLYCYTCCFDAETKTLLCLVSPNGTPEQFQQFRQAAIQIRQKLGIRQDPSSSILEILDTETSFESSRSTTDVHWRRSMEQADTTINNSKDEDEDYEMIPYFNHEKNGSEEECGGLLKEIQATCNTTTSSSSNKCGLVKEYLEIAGCMHFVFRLDIAIRCPKKGRHHPPKDHQGHLPQCISSSLDFPFVTVALKRRVWNMYQKLNLRLRLGSASVEATMDAMDMITQDHVSDEEAVVAPGIGRHCPVMGLVESPPNIQGVSYIVDGSETFLAMNGREFELYLTVPSVVPVTQAAAQGARLARRLMMDQKTVFVSQCLTWKE